MKSLLSEWQKSINLFLQWEIEIRLCVTWEVIVSPSRQCLMCNFYFILCWNVCIMVYYIFSLATLACLVRQLTATWSCLQNLWKSGNHVCSFSAVGLRLSKCILSRVFCLECVITSMAKSTFSLSQCYKETLFQLSQVIVLRNSVPYSFFKEIWLCSRYWAECYIC